MPSVADVLRYKVILGVRVLDTQRLHYCYHCGGKLEKTQDKIPRMKCTLCSRISYENPIVGVAGMIFDEKGRILLVRRSKNVDYSGLWCIPCGYVEYNEDIRSAVAREVREETGLIIKPTKIFTAHSNFHNPKQHTVGIWFLCSVISGELCAGDDADKVQWFCPQELPKLAFVTDKLVLNEWIGIINKEIL